MINKTDINRLIKAYKGVQDLLTEKEPSGFMGKMNDVVFRKRNERTAAKILCKELGWLAENSKIWDELGSAAERLKPSILSSNLLNNVKELIYKEEEIFQKLKIQNFRDVTAFVLGGVEIVNENPSKAGFENLRDRLRMAVRLICEESRGQLQRAFDNLIGYKGLRILAGTAVAGADVAVAYVDQGTVSWTSLAIGYNVMTNNVEGIIKILRGDK